MVEVTFHKSMEDRILNAAMELYDMFSPVDKDGENEQNEELIEALCLLLNEGERRK